MKGCFIRNQWWCTLSKILLFVHRPENKERNQSGATWNCFEHRLGRMSPISARYTLGTSSWHSGMDTFYWGMEICFAIGNIGHRLRWQTHGVLTIKYFERPLESIFALITSDQLLISTDRHESTPQWICLKNVSMLQPTCSRREMIFTFANYG